jgi:trigger factor
VRTVEVDFPPDYRSERLAGKHATFEVEVKDVKEKRLPDLDDDFASEASEFDTLDELRASVAERLRHAQEHAIEDEFREAVVDTAAAEADLAIPDEIVRARAEEMWERTERAMQAQGLDPDAYLKATGKTRDQVLDETMVDAATALARESVLAAVAEAEGIEVTDAEVVEALAGAAEREKAKPEKLLERLSRSGRDLPIRRDLRLRKALDLLVDEAKPIDPGKAKAREQIWTPDKQRRDEGSAQLWTPGDAAPGDAPAKG